MAHKFQIGQTSKTSQTLQTDRMSTGYQTSTTFKLTQTPGTNKIDRFALDIKTGLDKSIFQQVKKSLVGLDKIQLFDLDLMRKFTQPQQVEDSVATGFSFISDTSFTDGTEFFNHLRDLYYKDSLYVSYPKVIYHSTDTVSLVSDDKYNANDFNLEQNDVYNIKEKYLNEKIKNVTSKFFLESNDANLNRKKYYANMLSFGKEIETLAGTHLNNFLNKKNNIIKDFNFGNHIHDYFLKDKSSKKIGKMAKFLLEDDIINSSPNNMSIENAGSNLFLNEDRLNSNVINQESLEKCYSLIFSIKNSENESFRRVENTDAMIGQLFTNNCLLFSHLYKDSWNSDKALENLENADEINLLNSNFISQTYSITKNISLLSLDNDNNKLTFNPYRKKIENFSQELDSETNYFPSVIDSIIQDGKKNARKFIELSPFFSYAGLPFMIDHILFNPDDSFRTSRKIVNDELSTILSEDDIYLFNTSLYTPYMFRDMRFKEIDWQRPLAEGDEGYWKDINSSRSYLNQILYFDIFPYEIWSLDKPDEILYCPKFMWFYNNRNFNDDDGEFNLYIKSVLYFNKRYFFPDTLEFCKKSIRDHAIRNSTIDPKFKCKLPSLKWAGYHDDEVTLKDYFSWPTKSAMTQNYSLKLYDQSLKFKSVLPAANNDFEPFKDLYNDNIKRYSIVTDLIWKAANFKFTYPESGEDDDKSYVGTGYILLNNSLKVHAIEDMKSKFINKTKSLTDESEFFTNRVVSYSNYYDEYNQSKKSLSSPLKESCFESKISDDDWTFFTTKLHKSLQNLKRFKVKKRGSDNSKKIINFYDDFLKKIIKVNSDFSLLYGDESELAIDNFNKSNFLQEINGKFYSKNNAQITQPGIQNKIDLSIESEIEDLNISSNEYKTFLSEYYPSGIAKNSKNLFKRILQHIAYELESANGNNLPFFKLLSSAIKENKSVTKVMLYSYLYKQLTNNNLNIKSAEDEKLNNDVMADSITDYIESVYSFNNIQKQKSYTLRTVDFPDTYLNADMSGDFRAAFGIMPGNIYKFLFPFYEYKYCLKDVENGNISNTRYIMSGVSELKFNDSNLINSYPDGKGDRLFLELFNSFTYNYDCYLSDITSFVDGKLKIEYIVKDNDIEKMLNIENDGSGAKISPSLSVKNNFINKVLRENPDDPENIAEMYGATVDLENMFNDDVLPTNLNYKSIRYLIRDKVIDKYDNSFYFKIIKEILEYLDTTVEFLEIESKEDIGNYINQNEDLIDVFKGILEIVSEIYASIYTQYENFSISNRISNIMRNENRNNNKIINTENLLYDKEYNYAKGVGVNQDVSYNIFESINNILSKDEGICELDKFNNISMEDRTELYTRLHENIEKSMNALNNSKILEAISHDIVYSYLLDFEEKNIRFDEFNNDVNEASVFISNEFFNNIGSDLNVVDILNNMPKMCKIHRKITEKYYYYDQFRGFLQHSNTTFPADDYRNIFKDFIDKDFVFSSYLNKEENIQKLISYGKKRLYNKDSSQSIFNINDNIDNLIDDFKYDVLDNRFEVVKLGISHEIAKILLNYKILQIKVNIFNHKYPELQFNPIEIYYTPMLTSLPTYAPSAVDSNEDLNRYLGFYNFNADVVEDLFQIIDVDEAFFVVRSVFENSKSLGRNLSDDDITIMTNILVNNHVMSNAIKYANYNNQKFLNEDSINDVNDILGNYIGNNMSSHYFDMSSQEFENIFGFDIDTFNQSVITDNEAIRRINKFETIKNKNHAYEFFDIFNQYVSKENIYENFIDNKFFDIYSFKITHTDILKRLNRDITSGSYNQIVNSYLQDDNSKNSYSYIIEADIL